MNCNRARSLFSARIDDELPPAELESLAEHLRECRNGCAQQWAAFQATVRLVHDLPAVEPDPSFVGQVLDRVRAWEAQEAGRGAGVPISAPWPARTRGIGYRGRRRAWAGVRDWISERIGEPLQTLAGARAFGPARLAGAVALGVAGGILLGQQTLLSPRLAGLDGAAVRTASVARVVPGADRHAVQPASQTARPFGDLAGEIPSVHSGRGGADSVLVQPDGVGDDSWPYAGMSGGRQVSTSPGDARPRVTITDGRPQLTF